MAEALVRESPLVPTKAEEEAVEATKVVPRSEAVEATEFAPRSMMVVVLLEVEGPYRAKVRHLEADWGPSPQVRQTEIQPGVRL